MAVIFLPGTVVHEFAHAIMAKFLFVYVGKMQLMPQLHGDTLRLGSVEVGKSDIIRNFLIGIAPFVVGTSLLLAILFFAFLNNIFGFNLLTLLVLSFIFVLSNTMYSSRKDMEGAVEFFIFVIFPILVLYFLGFRIPGLDWNLMMKSNVENFFRTATIFLGLPLVIDTSLIIFAKIILRR